MPAGARGSGAIASRAPVPDYDPLTISDEDLKKLPAAERGAVYKARAAARAGGAAPAPAARPPAASAPAGSGTTASPSVKEEGSPGVPAPSAAAQTPAAAVPTPSGPPQEKTSPSEGGTSTAVGAAKPPAATPAPAAAKPAPAAPKEPEKPSEPPFVQRLLQAMPEATFQWRHGYAEVKVPRAKLLEAATQLKAEGFDYLSFITEVDWPQTNNLELIYHLFSYDYRTQPLGMILRTELPREGMPEVASLTAVWPGAEFMEREAFEMMGIIFLGHPDLRRILLPDDFVGFPMRRDFETDWDYITVKQLVHETD